MSRSTQQSDGAASSRRGSAVTVLLLALLAGIAVAERSRCGCPQPVSIDRALDACPSRTTAPVAEVATAEAARPEIRRVGIAWCAPRFLRVESWGLPRPRAPGA